MSGLFGGSKKQAAGTTVASGLNIQSSVYGQVKPIVYGTTRIGNNLIWYGDFTAVQQASSGGGGGKGGVGGGGGGKGGGGSGTYQYSTSMALALCEGPIYDVPVAYVDKNVTTPEALGMSIFDGTYPQAPWGYLNAQHSQQPDNETIPLTAPYTIQVAYPNDFGDLGVSSGGMPFVNVSGAPGLNQYNVSPTGLYTFNAANAGQAVALLYVAEGYAYTGQNLAYNGLAYVAASAYPLGTSPQLPNHNFVVAGVLSQSLIENGAFLPDADPSLILIDLLTNPYYGAGFPAELIGDLSQMQNFCLASGLVMSPSYTSQVTTSSMIDDLMTASNCAMVWSNGKLNVYSYGDQTITNPTIQPIANSSPGVTFTAPTQPLYNLTDDDFMENQGGSAGGSSSNSNDPIIMTRTRPADAYNSIKIEYLDDTNYYNPAISEAKDQASIDTFGLRQDSVRTMHMFCNSAAAQTSAQLQLQRQQVRNLYSFTLDQRFILLDPMDIVALNDSYLGLINHWVRITSITENDDYSLSFIAEDYLYGTGTAAEYSFQTSNGFNGDYNATPPSPNLPPVLFEPTAELAEELAVYMAISGPPEWGGCQVWISTDDINYKMAGTVTGSARTGVLSAPLGNAAISVPPPTIDLGNTLSVNLSQSDGTLTSGTQQDAINLNTLCYVDGEYIAYEQATLTADNQYNLTYLVRGAYDTTVSAHAAGTQFARMDAGIFKYAYQSNLIGTTIYIKLLSFNVYGGGIQGLADVTPFTYVLQGTAYSSPLPDVPNLRSVYVGNILQLSWDEIQDFRPFYYEIRRGATWASGQFMARVAHPPYNVPGDGTYWVAGYSNPAAGIVVYSPNPVDITVVGSQLVDNIIATRDEASLGWPGIITGNLSISGGSLVSTPGGSGTYTIASGTFLTNSNFLAETNFLAVTSETVNIGYVAPCGITMSITSSGNNVTDNFLATTNFLGVSDILDAAAGQYVTVTPQVGVSQDFGTTFAWQNYTPGYYVGNAFLGRLLVETTNPQVQAIIEDFQFIVNVPDRVDHYMNLAVTTAGYAITFAPDGQSAAPFNGGPNGSTLPYVQVTILNAQQGDDYFLTSFTDSGLTITIKNGGTAVARTVSVAVQGY